MREQRIIDPIQTRRAASGDMNVASPQRAGHYNGIHPEDRPHLTDEQRQRRLQTTMHKYDDGEGDEVYETRTPTSARRYQVPVTQGTHTIVRYHRQPIPQRSSRTQEYPSPTPQQTRSHHVEKTTGRVKARRQWHGFVYAGLSSIIVLLVLLLLYLVGNWWHSFQDDLHYGRPRTYQCDVRVGHDDAHTPSHFLAVNLNKRIEIIELPAGDATKAKIYQGPTLIGNGQELTPVTLEFRDVNGDGKPDMILHIGDSRVVFINDNGQFRLAKATDNIIL